MKIGILIDKDSVDLWQYLILKDIAYREDCQLTIIVLGTKGCSNSNSNELVFRLLDYIDYQIFVKIAKLLGIPDALENIDLASVPESNFMSIGAVGVESKGPLVWLDESGIKKINELNFDLVLYFGVGILSGDILTIPRYGVFSIRHGGRVGRGNPENFIETIKGQNEMYSSIQRINGSTENNKPIYSSFSGTESHNVHYENNRMYWKSTLFVNRLLDDIKNDNVDLSSRECEFDGEDHYSISGNCEMVRILPRLLFGYAFDVSKTILSETQWMLLHCPIGRNIRDISSYNRIVPPRDRFYADPFLISEDINYIFFEEYMYLTAKAHISVMELCSDGSHKKPSRIIEQPFHLSYPFIFRIGNEYFIVPESCKANRIDIYSCESFPTKWRLYGTLMKDINAVDSTLLHHGGIWWLFSNIISREGMSYNDELHLYYSKDVFSSDWVSHPKNPIISDARTARPAGRIIIHDGRIIRPSQDCGPSYGYGISFNEITKLSKTEYSEQRIASVYPKLDSDLRGIHTFNMDGGAAVIDARRCLPIAPNLLVGKLLSRSLTRKG
ncbi:MAG: hypothetical protein WCK39_06735 [Methanomassiliicoccales archaeon]